MTQTAIPIKCPEVAHLTWPTGEPYEQYNIWLIRFEGREAGFFRIEDMRSPVGAYAHLSAAMMKEAKTKGAKYLPRSLDERESIVLRENLRCVCSGIASGSSLDNIANSTVGMFDTSED